jgi:hypothetical protein
MTACALTALAILSYAFTLEFPEGVLQNIVPMPWPFN